MIDRLQISNFKCLREVDVEFGPFNILIGPNDSGKSSLLQAIAQLGKTARTPLAQAFANPLSLENLVWRRDQSREVVWKATGTAATVPFSYHLALAPGDPVPRAEELLVGGTRTVWVVRQAGQPASLAFPWLGQAPPVPARPGSTGLHGLAFDANNYLSFFQNPEAITQTQQVQTIAASLGAAVEYRLDSTAIRESATPRNPAQFRPPGAQPEPGALMLSKTGDNLVEVLDAIMTSPRRADIINLEKDLHDAISTLSAISLPLHQQNGKTLAFTLTGDEPDPVTIPAALVSDGALLVTAFLALAHGNAPEILFVEEPENGLHYSLVKLAVEMLRKISTGTVGNRPRQVFLTTHSPILLNFAKPEEVRVFSRIADGATRVTSMENVPHLKPLLEEFGLGELWLQLGEERMVQETRS